MSDDLDPLICDAVLRERIRRLMEQPREPSKWNRLLDNRITHLILGFIFTAVLGGALTTCYQNRSASAQREAEVRETRRLQALAVVDTVGLLLTRGYYVYSRYYDALSKEPTSVALASARDSFSNFNGQFESRWFLDAARVRTYFGAGLCGQLSGVARTFHYTNPLLRDADPGFTSPPRARPDTSVIYQLRNEVFDFVLALANTLPRALNATPSSAADTTACHRPFGTGGAGYTPQGSGAGAGR